MKNKKSALMGLCILSLFIGAGLLLAGLVNRQATLTTVTGGVEWLKAGSADWKAATLNQSLGGGDRVRTGGAGEAILTFDDGSATQVFPNSELAIQSLTKDAASGRIDSVLGILKGKLRAEVTPLTEGSSFQVETPVMVTAVKGTTLTVGVNDDSSINLGSEDGDITFEKVGENAFKGVMDTGDEALVEYDPATGDIKITSLKGTFEVTGPDGVTRTLGPGDSIIYSGGAATFIPAGTPTGDAPATETFAEPASL